MAAEASEEVPRPEERYMHMSCGHAKHMSCMHVMRCTCNVSLHYPDDRRDELSRRRDRVVGEARMAWADDDPLHCLRMIYMKMIVG